MKIQFCLLPFEELILQLKRYGFADRLDTIMKVKVFSVGISLGPEMLELSEECREKYNGTWWETPWPLPQKSADPPQCYYVADSLRDALRLRPRTELSSQSSVFETPTQYARQIQEWMEEREETEMAD